MLFNSLLLTAASFGLATAAVIPEGPRLLFPRQTTDCTNSATDRQCWDSANGFSIDSDPEVSYPNTGVTVEYTLTLDEYTNVSPDGTSSKALKLFNGVYPGPVITANWGDTLSITVINNLSDNGTSIHWHGISQKETSTMDGVNGVTECPIPGNGGTKTYTFIANEFGTTWYHSHYSAQYGDGTVGTIIINGPATANYDLDLGTYPISDWYYLSMYDAVAQAAVPVSDNVMINGTNKNVAGTTGAYAETTLTPGKKHRLRIINTSVEHMMYFSLDNHTMEVIQADFVAVEPYNATWVFIGIGQRYDVVIDADQTPDNYWFRVVVATGCGNNKNSDIKSIFTYEGVTAADPTSTISATPSIGFVCEDETSIVSYVPKAVDQTNFNFTADVHDVNTALDTASGILFWTIDDSSLDVDWENPTLSYVANDTLDFPSDLNVYQLPTANQWIYWVIQQTGNLALVTHPIHLHGHDFSILGHAPNAVFTAADADSLNWTNPPRRDVALLPASGYLVIAFQTDNPGAWLMHCHIAWHIGLGLGVQFLERPSEIASVTDLSNVQPQCDAWDNWYATAPYPKSDSGL